MKNKTFIILPSFLGFVEGTPVNEYKDYYMESFSIIPEQNILNAQVNIIGKDKTECKPNDEFIISIDRGAATLKKQIDFSDWGPCVYEEQNSCLVVTCVSRYDGAHRGQFTDCKGGKSCQRFEICDNSIKTFYKNSREDFVADDPSFHLNKLSVKEVSK